MLAWLPEHLIYGRPKLIDIVIVSGLTVAQARDNHYHNPPGYLVLEPEDTTARTSNLQQTNTNGFKFQGTPKQFKEAKQIVDSWGAGGADYKPDRAYQKQLRQLIEKYKYRLDTNYAKMDRIVHEGIEAFKTKIYNKPFNGMTIGEWNKLLNSKKVDVITYKLDEYIHNANND